MTALKGFAESFEEPAKTIEPMPRPGTMAHLKWVEQQKQRQKEAERTDTPGQPPEAVLSGSEEPEESPEQVRLHLKRLFTGNEVINRAVSDSDPVSKATTPLPATVSASATVSDSATVPVLDRVKITSNFFAMDNDVFDKLPERQSPAEQVVYRYLYRIAYGWHRQTCFIGLKALSKRCNMSKNTVRLALDGLESKGHIKTLQIFNEKEMKGTMYRVYLPREIPGIESVTCFHTTSP